MPQMPKYEELHTDTVDGYFDEGTRILRVTYQGVLTPDTTRDVYAWIGRLIASANGNIHLALGSIYDFRAVRQFDSHTLSTAQKNSTKINRDAELRYHPVALVVRNRYQYEYVRLTMKITPQEERKRIVYTIEEAEDFIKHFCEKYREFIPGLP
ncbi:MAG: hypothetical protein CUN56_04725 [Phototrophicales bacterium]|nr:MAG: hypothetical protein CUN56_04725 [Phototrophicales bacterium]